VEDFWLNRPGTRYELHLGDRLDEQAAEAHQREVMFEDALKAVVAHLDALYDQVAENPIRAQAGIGTIAQLINNPSYASSWLRVPGWRRDRRQLGRGVGPDEQHMAGGVVDDEARRRADAAWAESLAVSVAGEDEDVHALGGGHDLALDASASGLESGWASQARLRFGEQVVGGLLGDRAERLGGRGGRWMPAQ
jgi:hypothetical protein